jgi:hypothetical protein
MFADVNAVLSGGSHIESYDPVLGHTATLFRRAFQTGNLSFGFEGQTDTFKYNTTISLRNIFNQTYTPITATNIPEPGFHVVWSVGFEY